MQFTIFPFLKSLIGSPSRSIRQRNTAVIKDLEQELIELGRWLDSGAGTPDDEDSLKEAIVSIKAEIRELSCV